MTPTDAQAEITRLRGFLEVAQRFVAKTSEDVVKWKNRAEKAERVQPDPDVVTVPMAVLDGLVEQSEWLADWVENECGADLPNDIRTALASLRAHLEGRG